MKTVKIEAESFFNFVENLLKDENGINEHAYESLIACSALLEEKEFDRWMEIYDRIEATDGRFYLPES